MKRSGKLASLSSAYCVYRKEFSFCFRTIFSLFGPQFSSDNSGDGPSFSTKLPSNPWSSLPLYESENYSDWSQNFVINLVNDLDRIISGEDCEPLLPTHPTQIQRAQFESDSDRFNTRNKQLYQAIYYTLMKCSLSGATHLLDTVKVYDGVAAWNHLNTHHNQPTVQNKLLSVTALSKLSQGSEETLIQFKQRVQNTFLKIKALNVTFADLECVLYLMGLKADFKIVQENLALSPNLTLEKVFQEATSFEQRQELRHEKEAAVANIATHSVQAPDQLTTVLAQMVKTMKHLASNNFSGKKRKELPTESEKKGTCTKCHKRGHAARTCWFQTDGSSSTSSASSSVHKKKKSKKEKANNASEQDTPAKALMAFESSSSSTSRVSSSSSSSPYIQLYADTGASSTMIKDVSPSEFTNYTSDSTQITTASGFIHSVGKGSFGPISDVLHVPDLSHNLLGVAKVCRTGLVAIFDCDGVRFLERDQLVITGSPVLQGPLNKEGMYVVNVPKFCVPKQRAMVASVTCANKFTLWHQRFCHASRAVLMSMHHGDSVTGLSFTKLEAKTHACGGVCRACAFGKQLMAPVRRLATNTHTVYLKPSTPRLVSPCRLVAMDLLTSPVTSHGGSKYALVLVDYDTKYTWVYFQKSKTDDETLLSISNWTKHLALSNVKVASVMTLRSDNGGEFVNKKLTDFLLSSGIKREVSPPYGHVALVERMIQTIQSNARACLMGSSLSATFWAEAVACTVYVTNRMTNKADKFKTPHELFTGFKPDVSRLRTFGCPCFTREYPSNLKMWDARSRPSIFVGYGEDSNSPNTWKVWHSSSGFINSSNIIFDESVTTRDGSVPVDENVKNLFLDSNNTSLSSSQPFSIVSPSVSTNLEETLREKLTKEIIENPLSSRTRSSTNQALLSMSQLPEERNVPTTIKGALKSRDSENWMGAVNDEINSLVKNQTFSLVERKSYMKVLGLKWVFKLKTSVNGAIERYKARCTALGNLQIKGFDYDETFSPVIRYSSLRTLLAIAASSGWVVHQMDVDTAFLYGEMPADESPLYVQVPHAYPIPDHLKEKDLVCKVQKGIYGLKQSPRLWNKTIDSFMASSRFHKTDSDPCLYTRSSGSEMLYVALYVDDLVITGTSLATILAFKTELKMRFNMKDLGESSFCLGMEIQQRHSEGSITLSQSKYSREILRRFGMLDCKTSPVPMEPGLKLSKGPTLSTSEYPYREVVGSLMYLMVCTRPDISFAVGRLSRYLNCHGPEHHAAAQQVLRYIKTTQHMGITYRKSSLPLKLVGYSDSDWASDVESRRSTSGYIFTLAGGAISWKSKLQPTVALSSTEAEYMALTATAQEAIALRTLCADFGMSATDPIHVFGDNQGSIAMAKNPVNHAAAKHIQLRHHFIREKVENGDIHLEYLNTLKMLADAQTKALHKVSLYNLRDVSMGLIPVM